MLNRSGESIKENEGYGADLTGLYDRNNVFGKVIRKEIPCQWIAETPFSLAFYDIAPKSTVHVLVVPKGDYSTAHDFAQKAREEEILDFYRFLAWLPQKLGLRDGYKLVSNQGVKGGQEVPHFHVHLMA